MRRTGSAIRAGSTAFSMRCRLPYEHIGYPQVMFGEFYDSDHADIGKGDNPAINAAPNTPWRVIKYWNNFIVSLFSNSYRQLELV